MNHALERQAQIALNISSMYSNVEQKKVVSVEDFQKSFNTDTHIILTQEQVKKYGDEQLQKSKAIESIEERNDFLQKSADEIKSLQPVHVVAEQGKSKTFFVKAKAEKKG